MASDTTILKMSDYKRVGAEHHGQEPAHSEAYLNARGYGRWLLKQGKITPAEYAQGVAAMSNEALNKPE